MIHLLSAHFCKDVANLVCDYAHELQGKQVSINEAYPFFAPLKKRILAATGFNVYDATEYRGRLVRRLHDVVRSMVVLRNGHIAIGSKNAMVRVFTKHMQLVAEIKVLKDAEYFHNCNALAELSDDTLAVGVHDKVVVWDFMCNHRLFTTNHSGTTVTAILALSDGAFVTGDAKGRLGMHAIKTFKIFPKTHGAKITELVSFGNQIVSSSLDQTLRVWTLHMECVHVLSVLSPVLAMCVLHDGRLAVGCDNQRITVWDETFTCVLTVQEKGANLREKGKCFTFAVFKQQFIVSDRVHTIVYE